MRHSNSKKLFTYWNNLRGDRSAPDRREIEPSDIRSILGDTFILEIDSKFKNFSFRLAGTRLCNAHGRELKGIGFLSLWDEKDNLSVYKGAREVFEKAKPHVVSYTAESDAGRYVNYEMLLLPLLNGPEHASRILGVASPVEKPIWMGIEPICNNHLKTIRPVQAEQTGFSLSSAAKLDPAEAMLANAPKRVKHLTIIEGGADRLDS